VSIVTQSPFAEYRLVDIRQGRILVVSADHPSVVSFDNSDVDFATRTIPSIPLLDGDRRLSKHDDSSLSLNSEDIKSTLSILLIELQYSIRARTNIQTPKYK